MFYTHLMVTKEGSEFDGHAIPKTGSATFDFCNSMTDEQDELAREVLERVAAKWPLSVLHVLAKAEGPLRFSRVLEGVDGISQKVLTQTLRGLERDGLITRTVYPQVPPRVEYGLTPLGANLLLQVVSLWRWIVGRLPAFEVARKRVTATGKVETVSPSKD